MVWTELKSGLKGNEENFENDLRDSLQYLNKDNFHNTRRLQKERAQASYRKYNKGCIHKGVSGLIILNSLPFYSLL